MKITIEETKTKEIEVKIPLFLKKEKLTYKDYLKFDGNTINYITLFNDGKCAFVTSIKEVSDFLNNDYTLASKKEYEEAKNELIKYINKF